MNVGKIAESMSGQLINPRSYDRKGVRSSENAQPIFHLTAGMSFSRKQFHILRPSHIVRPSQSASMLLIEMELFIPGRHLTLVIAIMGIPTRVQWANA